MSNILSGKSSILRLLLLEVSMADFNHVIRFILYMAAFLIAVYRLNQTDLIHFELSQSDSATSTLVLKIAYEMLQREKRKILADFE